MARLADERARWLARCILPHEPGLRRWLRGLGNAAIDADDVVQETYALLAALDSVDHIRDPRAYLYASARSVLLQQVRRARIVPIESMAEIDGLCIQSDGSPTEDAASERQQLMRLARHIAGLPEKCREAFVLRKVHGYSQREIAARMAISESTVEKHVGKGLRLLMQAMAGADAGAAGLPAAGASRKPRWGKRRR
jgi:RNA polymerase sigma-70 factor (ECF subfamily)